MFVVEISTGDMNQLRSLLLNGCNDFRMAVAGRCHGDASGEVKELVAIHIFNAEAAAALGHQRIGACVAGRDEPCVGFDGCFGLGARQRTQEFGAVLSVQFVLGHDSISSANGLVRLGLTPEEVEIRRGPGRRVVPFYGSVSIRNTGEDLRRSGTNRRRRG